jgi:cell division protein ZapA (FtsZ GTPase activity inhibitor)
MRAAAVILTLLALAGCGDRRSFDERYKDTSANLEQRARALDQNLTNELDASELEENTSE